MDDVDSPMQSTGAECRESPDSPATVTSSQEDEEDSALVDYLLSEGLTPPADVPVWRSTLAGIVAYLKTSPLPAAQSAATGSSPIASRSTVDELTESNGSGPSTNSSSKASGSFPDAPQFRKRIYVRRRLPTNHPSTPSSCSYRSGVPGPAVTVTELVTRSSPSFASKRDEPVQSTATDGDNDDELLIGSSDPLLSEPINHDPLNSTIDEESGDSVEITLALLQQAAADDRHPTLSESSPPVDEPTSTTPRTSYGCALDGCGRAYEKRAGLAAHVRRHTGERPFRCPTPGCDWRFSRSDELVRHRRSHSGVRPYPCRLCDKRFARSDHLAKHQKVHLHRSASAKAALCSAVATALPVTVIWC